MATLVSVPALPIQGQSSSTTLVASSVSNIANAHANNNDNSGSSTADNFSDVSNVVETGATSATITNRLATEINSAVSSSSSSAVILGGQNQSHLQPQQRRFPLTTFGEIKNLLYSRFKADDRLSNGQTVDEFRRGHSNCFYCDRELVHNDEGTSRVRGAARIAGLRQRKSTIDHVYPNDYAIQYGNNAGYTSEVIAVAAAAGDLIVYASPVWWNRYNTDVEGLVVCCNSCNAAKQDKALEDWRPPEGRPFRDDAIDEAREMFARIREKYDFSGPND